MVVNKGVDGDAVIVEKGTEQNNEQSIHRLHGGVCSHLTLVGRWTLCVEWM